jgi:hypothetical protein
MRVVRLHLMSRDEATAGTMRRQSKYRLQSGGMRRFWLAALYLLAVLKAVAEIDRTFVARIYAKYVSTDYPRHDMSVI